MQVMSYLDEASRRWDLYAIEFDSPDGTYTVTLYAISHEHAQLQLQSLKENGRVMGQIDRFINEDGADEDS